MDKESTDYQRKGKGGGKAAEAERQKRETNSKIKLAKKIKVKFLIPVYKYYHPLKQIYFMDMIFPLDIKHAGEEEYHVGKLNLIKNVQIRPLVKYNKKTGYISITYDSPSIHILHNQCDYFIDYLSSLGDDEMKKLSDVLNSWKNLWSKKDIFEIHSKINVKESYREEEAEEEGVQAETCTVTRGDTPSRQLVMKKLYYFERIVTYTNYRISLNRFTLYYSADLLKMLQIDKEDFFNQVLYFKHPIIIKPLKTLEYRINLLSQILNGDYPRLQSDIIFESGKKNLLVNPFLQTQRAYAMKQDTIIIRCSFSYLEEQDLKFIECEQKPSEAEFDTFAKKQNENVAKRLKTLLNS